MSSSNHFLLFLLFLPTVIATCVDSDGGPHIPKQPQSYIDAPGTVVSDEETYKDYCMKESGEQAYAGPRVREFHCLGNTVVSNNYTCAEYGFGECFTLGGSGYCTSKQDEVNINIDVPTVTCGDNKTEEGEDCELDNECGEDKLCNKCTCEDKPTECGNNIVEKGEKCEATPDCTAPAECVQCQCIDITSILTVNENETLKNFKPERPKNFNESLPMQAAYGLASFGRALWHWLLDLF